MPQALTFSQSLHCSRQDFCSLIRALPQPHQLLWKAFPLSSPQPSPRPLSTDCPEKVGAVIGNPLIFLLPNKTCSPSFLTQANSSTSAQGPSYPRPWTCVHQSSTPLPCTVSLFLSPGPISTQAGESLPCEAPEHLHLSCLLLEPHFNPL